MSLNQNQEGLQVAGRRRIAFVIGGFTALLLAVVGAILPVMPATPFILLAAYCFARGSTRWHAWLTTNRLFGRHVARVVQGQPLSWRLRVIIVPLCWLAAVPSVILAPNLAMKLSSVAIAAGMTAFTLLWGRRAPAPTVPQRRSSSR